MKVILKKLLCIVLALTTVFSGLVFTSSAAETKESSVIPVNSIIDYAFREILKLVWLISDYEYDPVGTSGMLEKGEKGTLTLNYRGADNMPESEKVEFTAYEPLQLPTLTKKGYHFVGWVYSSACIGTEITLNRDNASIYPFFEKDYTAIQSPVALFTDEFEYTEYSVGEYSNVNIETTEIFVESGYKVTVYERKNFKGDSKTIAYTEYYEGKIGSMKITETKSEGIEVDALTDDVKAELLKTFAPRIWWDENEEYYACTVEDAKANMSRVMSNIGYVYVIEELNNPFYMNDYLYGSKTDAKAYAFAVEKEFEFDGIHDMKQHIQTPDGTVKLSLAGEMQRRNFALVYQVLKYTSEKFDLNLQKMLDSMAHVSWPGRFQIIDDGSIIDGGHNPDGTAALAKCLKEYFPNEKFSFVFASFEDKDTAKCLENLLSIAADFSVMPLTYSGRPSCSAERLAALIKGIDGNFSNIREYSSLEEYLNTKEQSAARKVYCGSLYLLGEYLQHTDISMLEQL